MNDKFTLLNKGEIISLNHQDVSRNLNLASHGFANLQIKAEQFTLTLSSMNPIPTRQSNFSYAVMLSKASNTYTSNMNNSWTSDIQLSIQQSLLEIASQMGQPLDEVAAQRLYQDSSILLDHIPCEPLTLARLAGTLLVYQMQKTEPEEVDWFKSQVQQCSTDEEIEELIESIHRTDAL